ncbi:MULTISPECIES: 2OG-Fe(II) oxygenase [unclassified Minwuia]|jgi:SM-20-related protein|uniref:2OG-Fe(II) oxygenase n=1 Tax=unclassified Minwuia TaxID=2618799 RepID=UPI002478C34F|nr:MULTISPECIES: 2OG-Fe(II) oxygenase [unclassified Minwuia]
MTRIEMERLRETPLKTDPYSYVMVENFVPVDTLESIAEDFPDLNLPGSFPIEELEYGPRFAELLERLAQDDFRDAVAEKFDIDLTGRPMTCTVRGAAQRKDGQIHTDSKTKLITVLIYLNPPWQAEGGRLRVLRSGTDLNDFAEEIEPSSGNLLIFKRSDSSWHGHEPFEGTRRSIQINWVTSQAVADKEKARHRVSAKLKRFNPFASRASSMR